MSTSNDTTIPYGYCKCGCGRKTNFAKQNSVKYGWIIGHPYPFIKGHSNKRNSVEHFWSKVAVTANQDACWIWTGLVSDSGYGSFCFSAKHVRAHRFAWELNYGEIPDGLEVCHRCDCRACCNPGHLFLGTHTDNMKDMTSKGRQKSLSGERNPAHKLSAEQVLYIRERYANGGIKGRKLAEEVGISSTNVYAILKRQIWKSI